VQDGSDRGGNGFALAIHGGAGTLRRGEMTAEQEALYRAGLARALAAGRDVLAGGGGALDAVTIRCSTPAVARCSPAPGPRRWTRR
jgi:isoaspartyl peptidase/L-asparaginase-like protein (Ntn-hydrolase superfamily)